MYDFSGLDDLQGEVTADNIEEILAKAYKRGADVNGQLIWFNASELIDLMNMYLDFGDDDYDGSPEDVRKFIDRYDDHRDELDDLIQEKFDSGDILRLEVSDLDEGQSYRDGQLEVIRSFMIEVGMDIHFI